MYFYVRIVLHRFTRRERTVLNNLVAFFRQGLQDWPVEDEVTLSWKRKHCKYPGGETRTYCTEQEGRRRQKWQPHCWGGLKLTSDTTIPPVYVRLRKGMSINYMRCLREWRVSKILHNIRAKITIFNFDLPFIGFLPNKAKFKGKAT